jgi:hypothetical protein
MLGPKEGEENELVVVTRMNIQCRLVEVERTFTMASPNLRRQLCIQCMLLRSLEDLAREGMSRRSSKP